MTTSLTQGDVEILLARELRKAGLALSALHVRRRTPLAEPEGRFVMLLEARLRVGDGNATLLAECHGRTGPVDAEHVRAFAATAREAGAGRGMLVSTSGFATPAVAAAREAGIALLAIADGATAWRSSPWGTGRPPAWFPEFVAQLVFQGDAGLVRAEPVQSDKAQAILERMRDLREQASERSEGGGD